uniref:Ephrin RBD domain-containing protein n=1 Tax=Trichobilharzia regenti TaxID=157069 RepID=A0AA85JPR8_TRIRE|nr:unnamed protein product [Trichobilharzia regenti]
MIKDLFWKFILLFCLKMNYSMFQDHIIIWDIKNKIFSFNATIFKVKEGDNIVFICPANTLRNQKLFWTTEKGIYEDCGASSSSQIVKLLDCNQDVKNTEFILKVAQFSEIPYSPHFRENHYVYFLGQQDLCSVYNLRIAVKLEPNNDVNKDEESKITSETKEFINNDQQVMNEITTDSYKLDSSRNEPLSAWIRYRFLLIPGSLGFLTLIGIQAVICALWHPKSPHRCKHCCTSDADHQPVKETPEVKMCTTSLKLLEDPVIERSTHNHKKHSLPTTIRATQSNPNGQYKSEYLNNISNKKVLVTNCVQEKSEMITHNISKPQQTVQLLTNSELPLLTITSSQTSLSTNNSYNPYSVQLYTCPYTIDGNFACLVPVKVNKPPDIFSNDITNLGSVINISV